MATKTKLFPLEALMLKHVCTEKFRMCGADLTDASGFFGVHTAGHRRWSNAQLCVTFIALRGLERAGFVEWRGQSRALKHDGYHYGTWTPTNEGMAAAKALR